MVSNQEMYIKLGQLCKLKKTPEYSNASKLKAILENDFDVNYKIPSTSVLSQNKSEHSGNTALHFFAIFNEFDYIGDSCIDILIRLNADLSITNDEGYTPLLLAFYKNFFVHVLLEAHFVSNNFINIQSIHGISHFHVACSVDPDYFDCMEVRYELAQMINFFLENGASVNERINDDSPKYPGYTPLHFAAKNENLKMIELLLSNGANIDIKDAKGETPLHILIKKLIREYKLNKDIELQKFLINVTSKNQDSDVNLWHLNLKCILQDNNLANQQLNQENCVDTLIKFESTICPGYTPLHLAAHLSIKIVMSLLLKGADLLAKDANGVTPLDICLKKFYIDDILDILMVEKQHQLSQIKFTDGTLLLHALQAMTTPDKFKQFLSHTLINVNTFIPFQSLIWPGYNFLHLGVLFNCYIPELLSYKADIAMLNVDSLSPLHFAFCMERLGAVIQILNVLKQVPINSVNRDNLSHLHIACAAGNFEVVAFLLRNGADPNLSTLSNFQGNYSYHLNFYNRHIEAKSTPLHITVCRNREYELIKLLLDYKANPHVANASGVTPFQNILNKYKDSDEKEILEVILNQMLETYQETLTTGAVGIKTLQIALTSRNEPEIVQRLVKKFDKKYPYEKLGLTRLQVACCIGDLIMVKEELKSGADVNQRISFDSSIWPGDSAMHILLRENPRQTNEIAELLLAYGANPTLRNASNSTPIHVCRDKALQTATLLLGKNFTNINLINNFGLSHFHLCCKTKNVHIVKEFLDSGVDINMPVDHFAEDYPGWTPLHLAVCYSSEEVVQLLLNHGADHKITNADGLPPLHQAISLNLDINSPNRIETILRHPAVNIQDMSIFGDTILMIALKCDNVDENIVDSLINIGVHVNFEWSPIENLNESNFILNLASKFPPKIFQRLIDIIPAMTMTDDKGRNTLHYFSSMYERNIANVSYLIDNTKILIKNGCELDQKDIKGETALHTAIYWGDFRITDLLISLGADINIKNDKGETPIKSNYRTPEELKARLTLHIQKMKEVGLYLEESNKTYLEYEDNEVTYYMKEEMTTLDFFLKEEVSLSFSAGYFFSEQFVVNYRRTQTLQRKKIFSLFNSDLREFFPNLIPLFKLQIRKARTRIRLLAPAQAAFSEFVDGIIPDLCLDFIFNYLSNNDMMNLIRAKNDKFVAKLPKILN